MSINEQQNELIEAFELFSDWLDKYEHIIEMGKELPLISPQLKTENRLIQGCQSKVWLHSDYSNGCITFTADSDALITKGLISLMISILSGHSPKEIIEADLYFMDKVGLGSHLSQTRSNGLLAMLKQMRLDAKAYLMQELN